MSSTGTRKQRDVQSRANDSLIESDKNFIANLKLFSGESDPVGGVAGQGSQSSPQSPAGNYLAREGDSMIGPIALGPPVDFRIEVDANNTINISPNLQNPQYSSNVELDSLQPNSSVLDIIAGAAFDGQVLILRTFAPTVPYTISQGTLGNSGNIQTPDSDDITFGDLQMLVLVFDEALIINANTGGTWRVLSGAGGSGTTGTFISAALSGDQALNLLVNDHVEFDTDTPPTGAQGGIVLQIGAGQANGIFELKAGKTYFLTGAINPILGAVTSVAEIAWYDITNATEIGRRGQYSNATTAASQQKCEIVYTPLTDVTVELRIVLIAGTLTQINSLGSFASIFEFSGKNGADGAPGADGSTAWKTPARANQAVNVPNLALMDVIVDGVTLVQNDRVLLTAQTSQPQNGLWQVGIVAAGLAPLTRPTDFDTDAEVIAETFVAIEEGTIYKNQLWHLISDNPLTINVSNQVWEQFAPGTSGGPDMGGGEDGIDGAGEFVNDGRVAAGASILKIWEKIEFPASIDPNNARRNLIYMPSRANTSVPGRLLENALSNNTRGGAYSDDYGETWTLSASLTSNNGYGRMAYAPNLGTNGTLTIIRSQPGFGSPQFKMQYSLDRGTSFTTTVMPNNGQDFVDLIWIETLGLFVATSAGVTTNPAQAVYTSPDGITWTARVTPAPVNVNADWHRIVWSETDQLIYLKSNESGINGGHITSPDGINWSGPFSNDLGSAIPSRIIHSEGQGKFAAAASSGGVWYSDDFVTWTQVFPTGLAIASDIVWAPDLSLWVVIGTNTTSSAINPIFWGSNDLVNWKSYPLGNFRTVPTSVSNSRVQIVYAEEFQYFFGMNSGFGTSQQQFYRTGQRR